MNDIFVRYPELRGKPRAMAMLCALLRDRGHHADALAIGEAAIAAAPASLAIRTEVSAALSRNVAGFHGPMLLDRVRNAAYARAIAAAVRPGMLVLEIGAGSGLLALMAARAGAEVVACELNPLIAAAAERVIEHNGLSDRIRIIAKRSDAMTIPDDLPRAADLVIHEIFGSQLFDEGVNSALSDARARLLRSGAPSLPRVAAIRSALAVNDAPPSTLADVEGFDLSPFQPLVRPTRSLWASNRRGLARRSAPVSALRMDYDSTAPFGPPSETIAIESTGGRIDGIVQWIEIGFADGTTLENDPFADNADSSWAAAYQAFPAPLDTEPGEPITVTLHHRGLLVTTDAGRQAKG